MIGKTLDHYLILKQLRKSGMVEVYLARDTSINRIVCIKFFAPELHRNAAVQKRFLAEAKCAAAINHPSICSILEIGKIEGKDFVAMEYVDGDSLSEKLAQRPTPLEVVLRIATEVAGALAAAHEKGLVHRNLKPANIILTQMGQAKVTDFGLARELFQAGRSRSEQGKIRALIRSGMTAGKLAYMSPEQLRGETVDARSDIFSFGVILYELIAGVHPFKRLTATDTANAIANAPPKLLVELRPDLPLPFQHAVEKMIAKEPGDRYQSGEQLSTALRGLALKSVQPEKEPRRRWKPRHPAAAAAFVILGAATWVLFRFCANGGYTMPPSMIGPATNMPSVEDILAISPDGTRVAFRWNGGRQDNWDIYLKDLDGAGFSRLTTDGAQDCCPAWSPAGDEIASLRRLDRGWALLITNLRDRNERKLTEVGRSSRLSWSSDGKSIAFSDRDPQSEALILWSISTDGLKRSKLTSPAKDEQGDDFAAYSPDGRYIAFIRHGKTGGRSLQLLPLPDGEPRLLTDRHSPLSLSWTSDSREIVFSTSPDSGEMSLWRIAREGGEPRKVPARMGHAWGPSVAKDRLACLNCSSDYNIWRMELTGSKALKPASKPLLVSTSDELNPCVSPDGGRIAYVSTGSGSREIWVCNSDGTNPIKLTDMRATIAGNPQWSPDGQMIAFDTAESYDYDIYLVGANGGPVRQITKDRTQEVVPRWSRDGQWIYFGSNRTGSWQVWKIPHDGGNAVQITHNGGMAALESADRRFVYYSQHPGQKKGVWQVPASGGNETLVVEAVDAWDSWTLVSEGIYFVSSEGKPPASIWFYDFGTRLARNLGPAGDDPRLAVRGGLSLSPDRNYMVYCGTFEGSEIATIENFR